MIFYLTQQLLIVIQIPTYHTKMCLNAANTKLFEGSCVMRSAYFARSANDRVGCVRVEVHSSRSLVRLAANLG